MAPCLFLGTRGALVAPEGTYDRVIVLLGLGEKAPRKRARTWRLHRILDPGAPRFLDPITSEGLAILRRGGDLLVVCESGLGLSNLAAAAILLSLGEARAPDQALQRVAHPLMGSSSHLHDLERWWSTRRHRLDELMPSQAGTTGTGASPFAPGVETKRLAVNKERLGEGGVYGNDDEQWEDFALLGLDFIRQFGQGDLLWRGLPGGGSIGPEIPADFEELGSLLSSQAGELSELFMNAYGHGKKVVLTFLTTGGGCSDTHDTTLYKDALDVDWASPRAAITRGDLPEGLDDIWEVATASEKLSMEIPDDIWDFSDPYKLVYTGVIAWYAGCAIQEALDLACAAGCEITLSDVVERIEIFNEVDMRNIVKDGASYDAEATAEYWARACLVAAIGFKTALPEAILFLPSVSSAEETEETGLAFLHTYTWRASFLQALLAAINESCDRISKEIGFFFSGMDCHWYHHEDGKERHIGYLIANVSVFRRALVEAGISDPSLTVCETGMSARTGFCPAGIEGDTFQQWEVLRRLGGVLASQADAAGWHSWWPGYDGYDGFGLRENLSRLDEYRCQKAAWFVYQRLARYLGGVRDGRVVVPRMAFDKPRTPPEPGLVIFEYDLEPGSAPGPSLFDHAYLLFVDPTTDRGSSVAVRARGAISSSIYEVFMTAPIFTNPESAVALPFTEATFASTVRIWRGPLGGAEGRTFSISPSGAPRLLLSNTRLSWEPI